MPLNICGLMTLRLFIKKLDSLHSVYFHDSPRIPFIFQEVIDMGEHTHKGESAEAIKAFEYTGIARVTNFIFGVKLAEVFNGLNPARHLKNWGEDWNMLKSEEVVVFIDNHDNQRGHGAGGDVLTFKDPKRYKMATAFMLAHPYGFTRVMSSFRFSSTDEGPPHNDDMSTKDVKWDPKDFSCGSGWVCEHRWRQIYNMVAFRNVVNGTDVNNWWDDDDYQIAFSRGDKGFIAINAGKKVLEGNLQTNLPPGIYCDIISGVHKEGSCTGLEINVYNNGTANIKIEDISDDPVVAIHIGAKKKGK